MGQGHPPAPWAALIAEFMVSDYDRTLAFWTGPMGFVPAFIRPAQRLACLTRPDGVSGTRDSFVTATDGDTAYTGWTFEYPWELQPGDWTIAFLDGDAVVASKTFHVTVPRRPGSRCPAPPVS